MSSKDSPKQLFLIPTIIARNTATNIPQQTIDIARSIDLFIVEKAKTARQYLKKIGVDIHKVTIFEIKKNYTKKDYYDLLEDAFNNANRVGVISESGCPGIADPGQTIVQIAHNKDIIVQPLVGPSSIFLALMASGFNGQNFSFNGYLPVDKEKRIQAIKMLERKSKKYASTEIFMETPYRNQWILRDVIENCYPRTCFCVAYNITGKDEQIISKSVHDWKKTIREINIRDKPAVFLIYAGKKN